MPENMARNDHFRMASRGLVMMKLTARSGNYRRANSPDVGDRATCFFGNRAVELSVRFKQTQPQAHEQRRIISGMTLAEVVSLGHVGEGDPRHRFP